MAIFEFPRDVERLDYRLYQIGSVALYYRQSILNEDVSWLTSHDYVVSDHDCVLWKDTNSVHQALLLSPGMPKDYVFSLAALQDIFGDIAIHISLHGGYAFVLRNFEVFYQRDANTAWHLIDAMYYQARYSIGFGKRLLGLVQVNDPLFELHGIGAVDVFWNRREALKSSRSL